MISVGGNLQHCKPNDQRKNKQAYGKQDPKMRTIDFTNSCISPNDKKFLQSPLAPKQVGEMKLKAF